MSKKIFALFLALFMLLQIPAVVDALDDFGVQTTAEAATYKLKKPVISKLTNVSGGVKVQWGKVSGAAKYRVFYKTSSTGSWKTAGDTASTSYTVKELSSGKTYIFTVRCVSKSGKSFTSSYDTTGKKIKYIAKPVISKLSNTSAGVKITWGKVAGAAKYRVLLKTSSGWKTVADTTSTSYTYKTTNSGKKYTFTVRCVSSTGKSYTSYYDTTGKAITFIAKPVLKKLTETTSGAKLTWGAVEGAYKYRVLRKTSDGWKKITDTAKTGYTYKNAQPGKSYTFTVRCIDKNGNYTSYYDTKGKKITMAAGMPYFMNEASCFLHKAGCTSSDARSATVKTEYEYVEILMELYAVGIGVPCEKCDPLDGWVYEPSEPSKPSIPSDPDEYDYFMNNASCFIHKVGCTSSDAKSATSIEKLPVIEYVMEYYAAGFGVPCEKCDPLDGWGDEPSEPSKPSIPSDPDEYDYFLNNASGKLHKVGCKSTDAKGATSIEKLPVIEYVMEYYAAGFGTPCKTCDPLGDWD